MRSFPWLALACTWPLAAHAAEQLARAPYASVHLTGVPHVEQRPDFCGEACAEMWLRKLGRPVDQDQVFSQTAVDPALGRGAWTDELRRGLTRLGFKVGPVWHALPPRPEAVEAEWARLHADLLAGVPSIVCMHYADEPNTTEHFRLVLGYDAERDQVLYHEPAEAAGADRRMDRGLFLKLWTFKPRPDRWTLIGLRLEAEGSPAPPPRDRKAEFAQHVLALKERLGSARFTIVVEPPFVIIGDQPPEVVRGSVREVVRWSVARLRQDFFARDPEEIIDVWAFKDARSYRRWAKVLFDDEPDTPYGYYSAAHHALVMNIGLGNGTLVHEIVHPYMRANFPDCPAWLNEGLASLYERPADRDGHIVGLVNWRLPGLVAAIRAERLPSFRRLLKMSDDEFYADDDGSNYAQARYLAYWLQQRGLLVRYVREARLATARDPGGYDTLVRILGEPDMEEFQERWEAEMLELAQRR